jgi:hypothetical protein
LDARRCLGSSASGETIVNVDESLNRLRELATPGSKKCLHCVATWIMALAEIAEHADLCRDAGPTSQAIADEVARLRREFPDAPTCEDHNGAMAVTSPRVES